MITGITRPACFCVLALNSLQNCMMFTPAEPRAGPTGGAGFAAPAGIWSLTTPVTFLAICLFLLSCGSSRGSFPVQTDRKTCRLLGLFEGFLNGNLLNLPVLDVDRDLAAEDVDFNPESALVGIHHRHLAHLTLERTNCNLHRLINGEINLRTLDIRRTRRLVAENRVHCLSGMGRSPPTNPITPGVSRRNCHVRA